MVIEHAQISVIPGREDEFAANFDQALAVIRQAKGFRWAELHRFIERESVFLLLVGWESFEDHMTGFRESELFAQWRAVIGPFFAEPPVVEHFAAVTAGVGPVAG
ncbi:MAG TPA: antibiotic biosynthesis monooxygenase [Propionicimonas sp.]|nr:antibiotic biosynthesis monooxygenase [Propionicimonas sp.]HQA78039.1 antibiotic biosynthesis monooxygenase [Propionicimonas sp.]HQD95980.1 antibiotic biosynthesis monooxygenase [Propionicimonas sp.]